MALEDLINARKEKLNAIIQKGIIPYPYNFDRNAFTIDITSTYDAKLSPGDEVKDKTYSIAGRITAYRNFGKLSFFRIKDGKGYIQVAVKKGITDDASFNLQRYLDIGDFVGVKGYVFKTHKGETTIMALSIVLLSKSIRPLPEKWHKLTDIDEKYRRRYIDLIVNDESFERFRKRSKIVQFVRDFFISKGYMEVEVPILQEVYGGAFARPFKTYSNAWDRDFYLSISPELYLKRLLVGGYERVFTISRAFRNEDCDRTHNPEFTILEAYAAYMDYNNVMAIVEELYTSLAKALTGGTKITYMGKEIDFKKPWKKITVKQGLKEYAGIDVNACSDEELKKLMNENDIDMPKYNRGICITELFDALVEDKLIQPTFVIDYPRESTPLCKRHRKDPYLVERFELFINGWELANAYSELNDPIEQRRLFKEQEEQRKERGEWQPMDEDFVEALEYGMPPAGGLGIGIDRLVMLFTNAQSIRDVILFPQMKRKE